MRIIIFISLITLLLMLTTNLFSQAFSSEDLNLHIRVSATKYLLKSDSHEMAFNPGNELQFNGKLLALSEDTLTLAGEKYLNTLYFNLDWVKKVELKRDRKSGILFGMLVGVASSYVYKPSGNKSPGAFDDVLTIIGGGFVGGVLVSFQPWKEVQLDDLRK